MKTPIKKLIGILFLITDFICLPALVLGCCFKDEGELHPMTYAVCFLLGGFIFLSVAFLGTLIAAGIVHLAIIAPIQTSTGLVCLSLSILIGLARKAWHKHNR